MKLMNDMKMMNRPFPMVLSTLMLGSCFSALVAHLMAVLAVWTVKRSANAWK